MQILGNEPDYHDTSKFISSDMLNFTTTASSNGSSNGTANEIFYKTHASVMAITWIFLTSTGILFASKYSYAYLSI